MKVERISAAQQTSSRRRRATVPAVIAEIKIEVERARDANPNSYILDYKTKRDISETEVDIILKELSRFDIMKAFLDGTHSVDINGEHSLKLMFPAKGS
ncbi:hypothetical protein [Pantoea agglomerans]|uniref:hypothetical protein n=1 Tax=Enterobacter agglomerans TaxID=549 RepID=UPI00320AC9B4